MHLKIYSDGGARGNPGPGAIGVVICDQKDNILCIHKDTIGTATNNMAEYLALLAAYEICKEFSPDEIAFHLDSELVVKQMNGQYKVKDKKMKRFFQHVKNEEHRYNIISYTHLPRTHPFMKRADKLVNEALDGE